MATDQTRRRRTTARSTRATRHEGICHSIKKEKIIRIAFLFSSYLQCWTKNGGTVSAFSPILTELRHHRQSTLPTCQKYSSVSCLPKRQQKHHILLENTLNNNNNNADQNVTYYNTAPPPPPLPPPPTQPSLSTLRKFYIPCLGLWISGPLLSLVDTATVGLSASPFQLGALGPATTFIDGATYLFAFLNTATTNLYARALVHDDDGDDDDDEKKKRRGDVVVRTASKISLFCGMIIMFLLLSSWGKFLLSLYIGQHDETQSGDEILKLALSYVRIRALSMPTSLLFGVLQAALLGAKDSMTPLLSVLYSVIVNISGDVYLVSRKGMGVKGAAIATLVAQWVSTIAMIAPTRKRLLCSTENNTQVKKNNDNKQEASAKAFLKFAAPVLTLILGKITAFGMMTHVVASLPSMTRGMAASALAAHQIILSLFFFISPFLEVISQTAQTFLPPYLIHNEPSWKEASNRLSNRLLRLGCMVGIIIAMIFSSIPRFFPHLLTNNHTIQSLVRPLAFPLLLGGICTGPVAVSEGILLARRELKYLAGVYVWTTLLFPFYLFRIKGMMMGGAGESGVMRVWMGFVAFQMFRAGCFVGKIWGGRVWEGLKSARHDGGAT